MKVLMFGWEFPPFNSGGLGVACYGLAKALTNQNVEITFVLPKKLDINVNFLKVIFADIDKIKVKDVDALLYPYITSGQYLKDRAYLKKASYGNNLIEEVRRYARYAREIAKKEQFDIIHAHDWLSFLAGIEAKKVSGKPLIIHVHATEFDRTGGGNVNSEVYEIEKEGMEKADKVVAISNYIKNIAIANYGIDLSKIAVVHNGIDAKDYVYHGNYNSGLHEFKKLGFKIVLFVGRLTLQKGPDYFLRAARKVLDYNKKVIFVISGSGDMERQVIEEAASLGISDKVLFVGFTRGEELKYLYHVADLFVMPSVSEPFGLTTLESLVNRTPVLISKQSGVSEVISHALKVDFWDVDEMTNKILAVAKYGSLKETLSVNGSLEVQKCTWDEAARKCIQIYQSLGTSY